MKNFEIIVSDNFSTDNTKDITNEFNNPKNKNISKQRKI